MQPLVASQTRLALADLLDRALSLPFATQTHRAAMDSLRRRLRAGGFRVVLLGNFQGGKSTTFNLLCGGQEISPRGQNIKTSATLVEASFGEASEIGAEIEWKNDVELAAMANAVFPDEPARTLTEWWTVRDNRGALESMRKNLPPERRDNANAALAMLAYAASREIAEIRATKRVSLDELSPYITFPQDWDTRWNQAKPGEVPFTPQECAFLFVRKVRCKVPSELLRDTGISIVDCPGLDSNAYETSIAEEAIRDADVIWYLMGGAKDIENQEVERIKALCATCGKTRRDFIFTVNLQSSLSVVSETILPSCMAKFHNLGVFDPPLREEEVLPYHALLALQCKSLALLREGHLPEATQKHILRLSKHPEEGVEEALIEGIENGLPILGVPRKEVKTWNFQTADGIDAAFQKSGFPAIWERLLREFAMRQTFATVADGGLSALIATLQAAPELANLPSNQLDEALYNKDCAALGDPDALNSAEDVERFVQSFDPRKISSRTYWSKALDCLNRDIANRTFDGSLYPTLAATQAARDEQQFLNDLSSITPDEAFAKLKTWDPKTPSAWARKEELNRQFDAMRTAFGIVYPTITKRDHAVAALLRARQIGIVVVGVLSGGVANFALLFISKSLWGGTLILWGLYLWLMTDWFSPLWILGLFYVLQLLCVREYCVKEKSTSDKDLSDTTARTWINKHIAIDHGVKWYIRTRLVHYILFPVLGFIGAILTILATCFMLFR